MPDTVPPKIEPAAPVSAAPAAAPAVPDLAPAASLPEPKVVEPAKSADPPPTAAEAAKVEESKSSPTPPPKSLVNEPPKEPAPPKPADEKTKPTEPVVKAAPPESVLTYEPFALPEGFEVDQKDMGDFTEVLKEFKAPQALGQKIIDLYSKEVTKIAEHQQRAWQKTLDDWKNDTLADPLLGGNRFQTVLRRCSDVLTEFATPEFRQMLDVSGIGNHPEMFRFLNRVAEFVGEPKPVNPTGAKPVIDVKPSRAEKRYGKNRGNGAQPAG